LGFVRFGRFSSFISTYFLFSQVLPRPHDTWTLQEKLQLLQQEDEEASVAAGIRLDPETFSRSTPDTVASEASATAPVDLTLHYYRHEKPVSPPFANFVAQHKEAISFLAAVRVLAALKPHDLIRRTIPLCSSTSSS
jgi:hypothetical protein